MDSVDERIRQNRRQFEEEKLTRHVRESIRHYMEINNISPPEMARRMDSNRVQVHRILKGEHGLKLSTLAHVAHALGMRVNLTFQPLSDT